jgi:integrase
VVNVYVTEHAPHTDNPSFILATAEPVLAWWGKKTLADVRASSCRDYVAWRTSQFIKRRKTPRKVSQSTARHDLKTLRAAIKYYHAEYGPLPSEPKVTLPTPAPAKERWLTKTEAATFVRSAHRRGDDAKHVLRFLLIGLHTATRSEAILKLRWLPSTQGGWIDVENGLLYRRPHGAKETKKRQPPARIPQKLLPWLQRWRKADLEAGRTWVISYDGKKGVGKLRRSWDTTRTAAGLGKEVTPHTLRHTAVTWQMQAGVPAWEVAGWAGMTVEMIDRTYGHHHAEYQQTIAKQR